MIFNLVEKTKIKIESFTLINIDEENCDIDKTVTITAPVHKNIAGVYKIWKYGNYGYVWALIRPSISQIMILFFDDDATSYKTNGPFREKADSYVYIYMLDPAIDSFQIQQIARGETIYKHNQENTKWYVQDQDTLKWNYTENIKIVVNEK